jgi:4-amino-4-deoxy-L-arabinose transferase-like glycosyltransferase
MDRQGWSLSLVIPAYNESAGIAAAIAEADDTLSRLASDYEVLVVDDGSRDDTFEIARKGASERPHVRVLRHEMNRGYGAALRTGFEAARFDKVAFTDADCQFDLNDLDKLAPLADDTPIVAGYRIDRKDPWRRRFLSRGYNMVTRRLLGTRVRDCDCALKVFQRDALQHILPNSSNFFVNTEMLSRARQHNLDIVEVGVTHRPRLRGESKVAMSDVPKTLATLIPFWWSRVMFAGRSFEAGQGGWLGFGIVMLMASLLFFCRLRTPLLEPEEARYAEIPRQMLLHGDWLVPTLNGQPYLDKPPLMYWLVMSAYSAFGVNDWAARLIPGLAGWLTIAVAYLWARRVAGTRAALLGALLLTLSAGFVYYGRMLTMNGLLGMFVTATLACGHCAMLSPRRSRLLWAMAGVCTGLGLLTKGPVAILLTFPPLLILSRLDLRLKNPGWRLRVIFLAALALVAAPWYVAVMIRHPDFAGYFFWFHNVVRFVQPFDHQAPPWDYIPGLLIGTLPWALLAIPMVRDLFSHSREASDRRPASLGAFLFLFAWGFLFFSLAGSKRPVYLVPVFPPLALALGCYLDARLGAGRSVSATWEILLRQRTRMAYWSTAMVLGGGVLIGMAAWSQGMREPDRAVLLVGASALGLAVLLTRSQSRRGTWGATCAVGFVVLFAGIHDLLPEYARRFSLRHPVQMHAWQAKDSGAPVVCYPHRFESIGFYTGRTDVRGFGRENRDAMVSSLQSNPRSFVFVQTRFLQELLDELPANLEFVQRTRDGMVIVGEVRRRREVNPFLLAEK